MELTADTNPHDVACLLKEFFRSLPEPLIPRELYHPFLQTRSMSHPPLNLHDITLLPHFVNYYIIPCVSIQMCLLKLLQCCHTEYTIAIDLVTDMTSNITC